MITLNKESAKRIWIFLSNPIFALVFSIVSGFFFYFISISYKSPSYFNTSPELVAKKSDSSLKILYKKQEVNNVYFTTLVIWNDGSNYIDHSEFIESKPIKFYSKDSIQILSVSLDKKSRNDLMFESFIDKNKVIIKLSEDEALEEGDGVSFNILYTKITNKHSPSFELESRVKGTKKGFVFKDVTNLKTKNHKKSIYILWSVIIILLSTRITILHFFKKDIIFRNKEFVFIILLIIITIWMTIKEIFYTTSLNWL